MIVETRNTITRKEYIIACVRIFYGKPVAWVLFALGVFYGVMILTKQIASDDTTTYYLAWFVIVMNFVAPLLNILASLKIYNSAKMMQQERQYIFDDSKISYKAEGWEGSVEWKYITKLKTVKHFILLYMASRQAIFIKVNGLTPEEINFIKSKATQTEN